MPVKLERQSHEFLQGYHAAITEMLQLGQEHFKEAEAQHLKTPAGLFGGATKKHHTLIGRGKAIRRLSDQMFERGQLAFSLRQGQ